MSYYGIQFNKIKTAAHLTNTDRHNNRKIGDQAKEMIKEDRLFTNVDLEKISHNIHIFKSDDLKESVQKRLEQTQVTVKKGDPRRASVQALEYIISASPDFFENQTKEKFNEWLELNKKFAIEEFGEKNIVQMVVHMDEKTPHIHLVATPIIEEGKKNRLSAKDWIDGPKKLKEILERYQKIIEPTGLQRGKEGSLAKHISAEEFEEINSLALEQAQKEINKIKPQKIKKFYTTIMMVPESHVNKRIEEANAIIKEQQTEIVKITYNAIHQKVLFEEMKKNAEEVLKKKEFILKKQKEKLERETEKIKNEREEVIKEAVEEATESLKEQLNFANNLKKFKLFEAKEIEHRGEKFTAETLREMLDVGIEKKIYDKYVKINEKMESQNYKGKFEEFVKMELEKTSKNRGMER